MRATATVAVVLASALASLAAAACGPYQCHLPQGCPGAPIPADFVFAVDTSGSMSSAINGVINGVNAFVNAAVQPNNVYNVDASFSLVLFSEPYTDPTLVVQNTKTASTFLNRLNRLTPSSLTGWRETGLETMRCIANSAATRNMNVAFRSGAKRVMLFFTDEDSDPANYPANSYQSVADNNKWCAPRSITGKNLPSADYYYDIYPAYISDANWNSQWQREITDTANILIGQEWSVYMLVNNKDSDYITCLNFVQYGNPNLASQNPDYTGWSASQTLANLRASYAGNSVQGLMLAAGRIAKTFYVYNAAQPTFVSNFLQGIANDITACDSCTYYGCSGGQCQTPVYVCDCAGQRIPGAPADLSNPNNVRDKNGACCPKNQIDCNGVCNGGAFFETNCGVCVPAGTSSPPTGCIQDTCLSAPNYYLSTRPVNGAAFQPLPALASPAGYMIAQGNADLINVGATSSWNAASAQGHYQSYGRFEGRYFCTFDSAYYASINTIGCSGAACETDFFTRLTAVKTGTINTRCLAGSLRKISPQLRDSCNQCINNPSSPPYCATGCKPTFCGRSGSTCQTDFFGNTYAASGAPQLDQCGVCNGGNTDKDDCGVCFGDNASKDPCGKCPTDPAFKLGQDLCGQNLCTNPTCSILCDGTTYSGTDTKPKGLDKCGNCVDVSGNTYPNKNTCTQQCDNTFRDSVLPANTQPPCRELDQCGNCVPCGTNPFNCVQDCWGVWGGSARLDSCNQCVGGSSNITTPCLQDCNNQPYVASANAVPPNARDVCGTCVLQANLMNKVIVCGQCTDNNVGAIAARYDQCGNCINASGYNATWCAQDCAGVYYNTTGNSAFAVYDDCGVCITPAERANYNRLRDNCGECWPSRDSPNWNRQIVIDPVLNISCGCNATLYFCQFYNASICGDCPPLCPSGVQDKCLRCSGQNPFYNRFDACGNCCNSDEECADSPTKDLCGTCLGPITSNAVLASLPCGKCPASTPNYVPFYIDCAGVCNGNSTYDCRNVCAVNGTTNFCTVCNSQGLCTQICGNGIREGTEACDDGDSNGKNGACNTDCTTVSSNQTGAIVGGVIGGIAAALALLAALAFLVYYAKKNGLMGFSKQGSDFSHANTNPMYKQQATVASNPLYQNV